MSAESTHVQHLPYEEAHPFITIAAPCHSWARPLTNGLRHFRSVRFEERSPACILEDLQSGQIDCGLISPLNAWQIDAGRVIPGIGVCCVGGAASWSIYVRETCQVPRRIAFARGAEDDAAIARVVIAQCLQVCPELLSAEQNPESLKSADALIPADDFPEPFACMQRIDVSKLWYETTGTPLVRALWVINARVPSAEIRRVLALALRRWEEESFQNPIPFSERFYYKMGVAEIEGIHLMAQCAAQYGICCGTREIVFC